MAPLSINFVPFAAFVAVALSAILIIGLYAGVDLPILACVIFAGAAFSFAWTTFVLGRHLRRFGSQARHMRQIAERMQAMLASVPEAYCVFSTQGILREATRVAALFRVSKIAHFEDLVAAIKEPEEFVAAFRKLQMSGEGFSMPLTEAKEGRIIQAIGSRMRIGRGALLLDIIWFGADQSATKAVEKVNAELAKTKAQLDRAFAVFDLMPIPAWLRDANMNIVRSNAAYARALDLPQDEILKGQYELTSTTARGGSGRALAAEAQEKGAPQSERRHVILAGKRQLLEITEIPYDLGEEGKGVFGVALNVTAEEEKETEIERHTASQREVLEHLSSAISIYGPDTRLEFYNRAYARLWRHNDESFLNAKPTFGEVLEDMRTRRVAPEQVDFQRYKRDRQALFTSLLEPREDLMYLPDGTTLRILVSPHPMGGLIFVHEDVTDKLALESSYNTLIAVQRETLDNLAEGIIVFGSDGKVGLFNPAAAKIWELDSEYLATNPHVYDLLEKTKELQSYKGDWNDYKKEAAAYMLDRNPRNGCLTLTNGIVLQYVTVPLPDGAVLNSYLDITDSIKAERTLRASNAALATADRLKSEFIANVSYQLRTPLNTIMGFSEILTNQYFGTLNDRQMEYARTIMEASRKLLLLINDVLDLATIEAGRMALDKEKAPVSSLLNAAKQMTAEWARQQSLNIVIDCPSDIGSFEVDMNRLKQVLFNLISNAVKYTPAGGRITLEARRTDAWIALTVADTGIGIPENDLDRIFGKFERANAQAKQPGAGLGLSLVKSFVELHGGRMEITSAENRGTRVTCYIPIEAAEK